MSKEPDNIAQGFVEGEPEVHYHRVYVDSRGEGPIMSYHCRAPGAFLDPNASGQRVSVLETDGQGRIIGEATAVEFEVSTNPADFGATHALKYDDGTAELLRIDGDAVLVRLG